MQTIEPRDETQFIESFTPEEIKTMKDKTIYNNIDPALQKRDDELKRRHEKNKAHYIQLSIPNPNSNKRQNL